MKRKKKSLFSTKEVFVLIMMSCLLGFSLSMIVYNHKNEHVKYVEDENLSLFLEQYKYLTTNYYKAVDEKKLINGAIEGMISTLDDQYSNYYNEELSERLNIQLTGYYDGIGVEIIKFTDGPILVVNVFENSDAYEKGIRMGDLIVEIDDVDISTISNQNFLKYIKEHGKEFKLKIKRENDEFEVYVKKSRVKINSVEYQVIDDYGYIKMNIFALNSYDQFKNAFDKLNDQKVKGLIIDLRDNGGGHLSIAEKILSLFLDENKVIYQTENSSEKKVVKSFGKVNYKLPVAIMVNHNSASASELITSALMEQLDAMVFGTTTYGKGTIQRLVELPNGEEYKITTDKWLTSNGVYIDGVGIQPDIEIENIDDETYIEKIVNILSKMNKD